jgi:uroporphyrinogen decarboxylase
MQTGFPIAQRVLSQFKGPIVTLLASGRVIPILDVILQTGTMLVGASTMEPLEHMKALCQGKVTVIGNLNAIEMCRWTVEETEQYVKQALARGAPGGGFILCDNHGEIPWQVPDHVLHAISHAVMTWGTYPLEWVNDETAETLHTHM